MQRTCLIVDDEPVVRTYLKAILRKEQYQTYEAENAPEAFKLVQGLDGGVSLIVSDINMPGDMDGLDLAHALRDAFPSIPVVLISGFADRELAKRGVGSFAFVPKPFTPEAILGAVNSVTAAPGQRCGASS